MSTRRTYITKNTGLLCALLLCLALTVAVSGCSKTNEKAPNRPSARPTSTVTVTGYPMYYTPDEAMRAASFAVEGTVTKIGKATWNTADRKKPATEMNPESVPSIIYTPYRVKVDKAYKKQVGAYLDVKSFGGEVDGERFEFEDHFLPRIGERVVIFVAYTGDEKNGDKLAIPSSVYSIEGTRAVNHYGGDKPELEWTELQRALKSK